MRLPQRSSSASWADWPTLAENWERSTPQENHFKAPLVPGQGKMPRNE